MIVQTYILYTKGKVSASFFENKRPFCLFELAVRQCQDSSDSVRTLFDGVRYSDLIGLSSVNSSV